ncbi:MAG TPA: hypothetical protein VN969_24375 [Streptosporangiaceae bacterium]|nr:hypothetical protein [Streptosporangiaceae bacterium]
MSYSDHQQPDLRDARVVSAVVGIDWAIRVSTAAAAFCAPWPADQTSGHGA